MSVQVAIFERMFDHGEVPALALASPQPTPSAVEALQARINAMQRTTLDTKLTPTHEALADLLPDGGLKQGAAYSVTASSALVMALLAGPSQAGSWCGVVGMPEFGVEAAEALGIDLDRLVLVPHPGDQWLTVTAAIDLRRRRRQLSVGAGPVWACRWRAHRNGPRARPPRHRAAGRE